MGSSVKSTYCSFRIPEQFLAPKLGDSQLLVTPIPGEYECFGLLGQLHLHVHNHMQKHTYN